MDNELREMIEGWSRNISKGLDSQAVEEILQAVEEMEALLKRTSPAFTEYDAARLEFEATLAMIGIHVVVDDLPPNEGENLAWADPVLRHPDEDTLEGHSVRRSGLD